MRFHIGFSKFIKPSKLLYWLGLGFLIILGYFGIVDNAFASTFYEDVDLSSYFTSAYTKGFSKTTSNGSLNTPYSYDINNPTFNRDGLLQLSNVDIVASNQYWNVSSDFGFTLNNNVCSNVADTNSVDFYFTFGGRPLSYIQSNLSQYYNLSNISSVSDVEGVYIEPLYSNSGDGPPVQYACTIDDDSNNLVNNYDLFSVLCSSIPTENVLGYKIIVFNDLYSTLGLAPLNTNTYIGYNIYSFNSISKYVSYQCSYVEPIEPGNPIFPEDIIGNSNVIINDDSGSSGGVSFDSNGSIDYSFIELAYPNTIAQFIQFPLLLANSLVNNHNATCQPISIDFSSITRRWGGSNYILTIPCLGDTIQDIFDVSIFGTNTTFYNLIDMFIAFTLLYMLATRMIVLINMMMSGQDLTGYLFSGTSQVVGADETTGEAILKKRRY